ncbi:hypothetical protein QZH41_010561, partial [Actinostola sp. cb2023]
RTCIMSYQPPQQQGYPPSQPPYPYSNPQGQGMNYQPSPSQYPPQTQQAYYQPQAYQQGNVQVNYGQQGPAVQQQVLTVQPTQFQQVPVHCQCPNCHAVVDSKVSREIGSTTYVYCLIMSLVCVTCLLFDNVPLSVVAVVLSVWIVLRMHHIHVQTVNTILQHFINLLSSLVVVMVASPSMTCLLFDNPSFGGPGDDGTGAGPQGD